MGKLFGKWLRRVSSNEYHSAFLQRRLRFQTALSLALTTLVLASMLVLVETDRRIVSSIQGLMSERGFEQQQLERRKSLQERYPAPTLVVVAALSGLRADRTSVYGYDQASTPVLEALASESIVFETACAQSSHALVSGKSLLTGMYPFSLMLEETGADLPTLASLEAPREYLVRTFVGVNASLPANLRAAGYRTAGFSDGDWISSENGFQRGFEFFEEHGQGLSESLDRVRETLFETRGERSFVFVHSESLTCPFDVVESQFALDCPQHSSHAELGPLCEAGTAEDGSWRPENLAALGAHYDGAVAGIDAELAELIALLRELDVYDKTLLVVTAGHGVSLGERGRVGSGGLALEQVRVPLIVKFPSDWRVPPRTVSEPVELVDLMPTLLAACGIRPPRDLDGLSFLSTVLRNVRGREYLLAQTAFDASRAVPANAAKRMLLAPGKWQVIHDPVLNTIEFYALEDDPRALEPIYDLSGIEVPSVLRRLVGVGSEVARAGGR